MSSSQSTFSLRAEEESTEIDGLCKNENMQGVAKQGRIHSSW
jgi:hypothetical protein